MNARITRTRGALHGNRRAAPLVALLLATTILASAAPGYKPDSAAQNAGSRFMAVVGSGAEESASTHGNGVPPMDSPPTPPQAVQSVPALAAIVQYSIVKPGMVSLSLYNLFGYEVATLVREHQEAGRHSVRLPALEGSSGLAPGVYFYRLDSGAAHTIRKVVLLK